MRRTEVAVLGKPALLGTSPPVHLPPLGLKALGAQGMDDAPFLPVQRQPLFSNGEEKDPRPVLDRDFSSMASTSFSGISKDDIWVASKQREPKPMRYREFQRLQATIARRARLRRRHIAMVPSRRRTPRGRIETEPVQRRRPSSCRRRKLKRC